MAKKPTILHIDDSQLMLQTLKLLVYYELKLPLIQTTDPDEGIKLAIKNQPDLVLLDAIMPKKDGFEVCAELKRNPKTKNIPVVMLTSADDMKSVETAFKMGAQGYIIKPVTVEKLIKKLEEIFGRNTLVELGLITSSGEIIKQPQEGQQISPPPPPQSEQLPQPVVCPLCSKYLVWIPQYKAWFCYNCNTYPQPQPAAADWQKKCPVCGGELTFLFDQQKWYCFKCQKTF
jgi:CheY-like chemotaxis protein/ribosomal protein L37AE/L43A